MTLANLLPGVRELRAPLAAGYLWLLFAWVALGHSAFPSRDELVGPVLALVELLDMAGKVGTGIAASFLAYLVGALSAALSNKVRIWIDPLIARRYSDPIWFPAFNWPARSPDVEPKFGVPNEPLIPRGGISQSGLEALQAAIRDKLEGIERDVLGARLEAQLSLERPASGSFSPWLERVLKANEQRLIDLDFTVLRGDVQTNPLPDDAPPQRKRRTRHTFGSYTQKLWMGLKRRAAYLPG